MKFKSFVIGLLAAILIVNIIGVVLMVREEQEQSRIALAEYDAIATMTKEALFDKACEFTDDPEMFNYYSYMSSYFDQQRIREFGLPFIVNENDN